MLLEEKDFIFKINLFLKEWLYYVLLCFFMWLKVWNFYISIDGYLRDFCDGEDFKFYGFFGYDFYVFVLYCYYDDF